MPIHTPRRVRRSSALALAACGLAVTGVASAGPATAGTDPAPNRPLSDATTRVASSDQLVRVIPAMRMAVERPLVTPTRAAIWSDRAAVTAGDPVRLSAVIGQGEFQRLDSATIILQRSTGRSWSTVGQTRTSPTGYAAFTVAPTATATYRVVYGGSAGYAPSSSAATRVTVRAPLRSATVVATAAAQSGKWYVFGAAGPSTFDCSGLTQYALAAVGISLPHNADEQKSYGVAVSAAAARPGDLVFFLSGGYAYHTGVYAGDGYMYDAPHEGATVGKHQIWDTNVIFRRLV